MNFKIIFRYNWIGTLVIAMTWMFHSAAYGQANYVLVQATEDKLFLPYDLQEPIPFADSVLLRGPSVTMVPKFELACNSFGAIDINRAFNLAAESDTVRYGVSGRPIDIGFMHRWYKVRIPDGTSNIGFAKYLRDSVGLWVESRIYADPDVIQQAQPTDILYLNHQKKYWGVNGDGEGWAYRMELPKAWAIHTGSPDVRIGVIDSGVDTHHDDLNDRDIRTDVGLFLGHGTQVASQIFAEANDDFGGMAGINWQAGGNAYWWDQDRDHAKNAATLIEAWTDTCQFINCSFKLLDDTDSLVYSAVFHEAVASVRQAGGIVIVSGGNQGADGSPLQYPAAHAQTIAVAALEDPGVVPDFSSRGYWLDFTSPGKLITAAHPNNNYVMASGTSISTPMVTAVASMIYSYGAEQGYELDDFDDIYNLFRFTVDTMFSSSWNDSTGWGLPKLDSAYWMITLPNALARYDVSTGWEEIVTPCTTIFTGVEGLAYRPYPAVRHDLTKWFVYPRDYYNFSGAWIRGRSSIGASTEEPITEAYAGEVLEFNEDSCLIHTAWYEIGCIADWPDPTEIHLVVTLAGEEILDPPDLTVDLGDPAGAAVLYWPDLNNNEQGHMVYYRQGTEEWASIDLGKNVTSHDFADALGSTEYSYQVRPYTVNQQTVYSDIVTVTTHPRPPINIQGEVLLIDPAHVPLGKVTAGDPGLKLTDCVIVSSEISENQPAGTLEKRVARFRDGTTYDWCWPCPPPQDWCCIELPSTWYFDVSENGVDTVRLEVSTTYNMTVLAVDIYGDTNVIADSVSFTTGDYPYEGTVHPVCDKPGYQHEGYEEIGAQAGSDQAIIPVVYELSQNYPNPFNGSTNIEFALPEDGHARLIVYDVLGQRVRTLLDKHLAAGVHRVEFDSGMLASGIYFYNLTARGYTQTKKMVLIK